MSALADVLQDPAVIKQYLGLPAQERAAFEWRARWLMAAHDHQIQPPGDWWTIWLLLAGRGAGKTRTAAEQLAWWAWTEPKTRWLVAAPTSADVRSTCFEGDSGLMAVVPQILVKDYNKQHHELTLVNGSLIKGIPASEPERFRGPQFHGAWFDELAAWDYLQDAWDMAMFGIRLGKKTRIMATTTPKPKDLIIELVGREGDDVIITRASTYTNLANLAPSFQKQILQYEGTRLGRQEIEAELIDAEESGIVKRDMFRLWPANKPFPKFEYIIQSYDCAYTEKTYNDPTAATTWGIFKPLDGPTAVMLIDAWQDHLQYPDLRPKVIEEFKVSFGADPEAEGRGNFTSGKKVDLVLIEDKAAGISLIQDLQRAHLPIRAYNPGRADKIQRLSIVANIISHKRVWIPESSQRKGYVRDWAEGFVSQICSFPDSTHDDFVDSCLVGETLIQMADGTTKRIDAVVVGDIVATPDGSQPVTAVFNNGIKEIWQVDAGVKLYGTGNHNVMTNTGWIHIDKLTPTKDSVYLFKGQQAFVESVTNTHTMRQVYDLTVANEHCYYANGVLVHNCTQALRYLRDAGFLDIDPAQTYDDDDYVDTRKRRENPYAV